MQRPTVLLLFGGESSEHDVSVSSARNVYAAIEDEKFKVLLGYIDPQGKWWLLETFGNPIDTHGTAQLLPVLGGRSFVTMPDNKVVAPDVILPILHGRGGEDGTVQGLAQLVHIPIAGADLYASATAMDKLVCKQIAASHGVSVVPYQVHHASDPVPDFNKLSLTLGSPVFVKPTRSGSSMGVTKVYAEDELARALTDAHVHGDTVLIEQAIVARELELGVLGTPPDLIISGVGEVKPGEEFYNYSAKYSNSQTQVIVPAEIDTNMNDRLQGLTRKIYEVLGCNGLARVDFFLGEDGTVYFNELNTMPGFTNRSMFPKLWREQGISYPELIERLLSSALDRDTIKPQKTEEN